ncbi:MAG: hypothetical protein IKS39_02030 [Clostridia bacterium]|nr:hypothetical protein [Clostridia bacterium]
MKRITALVLCIQLIFIYSMTASAASAGAIKIDGKNSNNEWRGYNPLKIFENSDPGNNVDAELTSVQFAFVSENNLKVFIAAQLKPKPESYDQAGFRVSFDGSELIPIIIGDGTEKKYEIINDDNLRIEGATSYDISGMIFCELDVTVKGGVKETLECAFRVIDGEGVSSAEAGYSFVNPFFTTTAPVEQTTAVKTAEQAAAEKTSKTTTERTTKEKTTKTTTEKTTKEKTTKTTTEKTTKEKTTKTTTEKTTKEKTTKTTTEKTTKEKTTKTTTEKTTKEKTTKTTTEKTAREKKTEADGISTFAVTEHSRRTAGADREKETAKTKAEKSVSEKKSTTKKEPEKVYVFEREVIVSETSQTPADTVSFTYTETAASSEPVSAETQVRELTEESASSGDDGSLFGEQGLSKASKYKIIAGVLAFILFIVIGVAAVRTKSEADAAEEKEKTQADTEEKKDDS